MKTIHGLVYKLATTYIHKFMSLFVSEDRADNSRSAVLVFLCFLVGFCKFVSNVHLIHVQSYNYFSFGLFCFWFQLICIPFMLKKSHNLYILSHYTLFILYVGALYSTYSGSGYMIVNCTVFPILPIFATFLFSTFRDSIGWCVLIILTNVGLYLFKADWEPGNFPTITQMRDFSFLANTMSMFLLVILGGVFNISSNLKQKELEAERDKAQELSTIKSEFTANVSHEIRTPLVAVIGLSELLAKDTLLTTDQRYLINTIYSASLHLDNLVNNVLNFSKTEANMTQLENTAFDVSELVEDTLLYFSAMAESCGIRLLAFIDPISTDGLCTVLGDPHRIQQILQNLVANAIKFCAESPQGEVLVTLDTVPSKRKEFEGRLYRFSVADNGIGMSKAGLEKIFQPFSQCDNSTTRRYGGTGLGLVICKQLVTLLGGELEVDSEEGKGTTITFTIPMNIDSNPNLGSSDAYVHPKKMAKRLTAATSEAAANASADAADAAEEAMIIARDAAKAAAERIDDESLTDLESKSMQATADAAMQTVKAAEETAAAALKTKEAAEATAEAFEHHGAHDQRATEEPTTKPQSNDEAQSKSEQAQDAKPPSSKSPQRSPLQQQQHELKDHKLSKDKKGEDERQAKSESESEDERQAKSESESESEQSPREEQSLTGQVAKLAKDFIETAINWDFESRQSSTDDQILEEQQRETLENFEKLLVDSNPSQASGLLTEDSPSPFSIPFPGSRFRNSISQMQASPNSEMRRKRSRSLGNETPTIPFSPQFRMVMQPMIKPVGVSTPPIHNSRARFAKYKRASATSLAQDDTASFSPNFQKILSKTQQFWSGATSVPVSRHGTTGYLEPPGNNQEAWERIRDGMRTGSQSGESDTICVLAGTRGAREVIKSSLLFRGLTKMDAMDGNAYSRLLVHPNPPRYRIVIAEVSIFMQIRAKEIDRTKEISEDLADMLDPSLFDPRISTRYILLISYKYHRFGKFIEFPVDPAQSSGESTVKIVFCAENPVRRSSLAQSLLACVQKKDAKVPAHRNSVASIPATPTPTPAQSRASLRILLCEDNPVNIEVLTRQLKKLGYTNCDVKHNGADGLTAFREKDYDIVLMDCQMPVLDGYETTKEIRKLEGERGSKKKVPIVALTASAMPEEREKGLKSGMDNYLSKPIQLAVLQNLLESVQVTSS